MQQKDHDNRLDDIKQDGVMYIMRLDPKMSEAIDSLATEAGDSPQDLIRDALKVFLYVIQNAREGEVGH